jgi:hypothetical protein
MLLAKNTRAGTKRLKDRQQAPIQVYLRTGTSTRQDTGEDRGL